MEEKNQVFHIPIQLYEKYMDTEFSRNKKKEIIELLTNHNQLRSQYEFNEIRFILYDACQKGDLKLIEIYLNESIKDEANDLTFKINKAKKTASLFKVNDEQIEHLIVPRTVKHESEEYLITSICWIGYKASNIKTIKFVEDSSVNTIYSQSFSQSNIEEIYFPKSLKELKEGWCGNASNLKKIIISPSNDQFIFKEEKYLLGKSDSQSDEFDVLLFASRDLKKISIPTNIKIISSYSFSYSTIEEIFIPPNVSKICEDAFNGCYMLTKVEILENSNLQTIEQKAFSGSEIKEIYIPANVSKIGEGAFSSCRMLTKVGISKHSKLQIIEKDAFLKSQIEEIYFPSGLKELKEGWCHYTKNLKKIIISPSNDQFIFKEDKYLLGKSDSQSDEFDVLLFASRDLKKISIPTNIKIISSYSFSYSTIEEIFIPPNVSKICEDAFCGCNNLIKVEIPKNSKLQIIGKGAFRECENLTKVEIPENSNLQIIEQKAFSESKINEIVIPKTVSKIGEGAFSNCRMLTKVEISKHSKLQAFEEETFQATNIQQIYIPKNVTKICENAFHSCFNLMVVGFSKDSKLQAVKKGAFAYTKIRWMYIPSNLRELEDGWCQNAIYLSHFKISNDQFIYKDKKYLLRKNCNNNEFDILLFVNPKIKELCIPAFISKTSKYAFCGSLFLKVEIPANSKMKTIESYAFKNSKIQKVSISPNISRICSFAFSYCKHLKIVEIPANFNLQIIENGAFELTNIESIIIPSNVSQIMNSAFSLCENLLIVEISEKSKLHSISSSVFQSCRKALIMIPASLKLI